METLLSLDAHAHIDPDREDNELGETGAILAMTLSLGEVALVVDRKLPHIAWGVGCHPRKQKAEEEFDVDRFADLIKRTPIVGEVGLDAGSHVPLQKQVQVFRQVLDVVAKSPRIVSIHSYRAAGLVLEELQQRSIAAPILHWWTGTVEETRKAVELGCYFSIHSAVARYSKFRTHVPAERILVETDHGWADPPAAIPCRIEWVEHLVAAQRGIKREDVRRLVWQNMAMIVEKTSVGKLLPPTIAEKVTTIL